jgi:hypothetical protein
MDEQFEDILKTGISVKKEIVTLIDAAAPLDKITSSGFDSIPPSRFVINSATCFLITSTPAAL